MKKISLLLAIMLILTGIHAQEFSKQIREVGAFTAIDAGGAFDIYLSQADITKVVIETETNNIEKIVTKVVNGTLEISSKGIKKSDKMAVYVTTPDVDKLIIHGAASLKGLTPLNGEALHIKASGASDSEMEVYYKSIVSEVSGAASVELTGEAVNHTAKVSGAGDLKAAGLVTQTTMASASGAGSATVDASDEVITETKGAGTVDLVGKPEKLTIISGEIIGEDEKLSVETDNWGDTTKVRVAGIHVEVIESDTTKVTVGNRMLVVTDDGNVKWCKVKKRKFNGHWAGVELGVNGFLTNDFNMKFRPEDEYMDIDMGKGWQVNLNLYEQNIALSKNQEWGMLTGIGIQWNNYRFRSQTSLNPDSAYLIGYIDEGISVRKSKLSVAYLQIPLLFEWQNQTLKKRNSFHVGLGVILGVRMWSWQKKYYNELNKEYTLTQYDPATGDYVPVWARTSPNYSKTHTYDDFHLQPFKVDASVRIGWGFINLFATYNMISMFRTDKGPELNQFAAGITLLGW